MSWKICVLEGKKVYHITYPLIPKIQWKSEQAKAEYRRKKCESAWAEKKRNDNHINDSIILYAVFVFSHRKYVCSDFLLALLVRKLQTKCLFIYMTNKWVYRCSYLWHYHLFFCFFFLCLSRSLSKPNEHNTRKARAHKKQAELSKPYKTDQSKCWSISNLTCHFFRLYW